MNLESMNLDRYLVKNAMSRWISNLCINHEEPEDEPKEDEDFEDILW